LCDKLRRETCLWGSRSGDPAGSRRTSRSEPAPHAFRELRCVPNDFYCVFRSCRLLFWRPPLRCVIRRQRVHDAEAVSSFPVATPSWSREYLDDVIHGSCIGVTDPGRLVSWTDD